MLLQSSYGASLILGREGKKGKLEGGRRDGDEGKVERKELRGREGKSCHTDTCFSNFEPCVHIIEFEKNRAVYTEGP